LGIILVDELIVIKLHFDPLPMVAIMLFGSGDRINTHRLSRITQTHIFQHLPLRASCASHFSLKKPSLICGFFWVAEAKSIYKRFWPMYAISW
jgi:hypothetical protein